MRVQSALGSYFLPSLGCEGRSCTGCDFPGVRPASAGSGIEGPYGKVEGEGLTTRIWFFLFSFFPHEKLPLMTSLSKIGRQLKDWQGGKFSTDQDVLTYIITFFLK